LTEPEWKLDYYVARNGKIPFRQWFESVNDEKALLAIEGRLARLRSGNFGTCESIGNGVFELKIYYGPGYRIYFGRKENKVILLLCGGTKSTQWKDIRTAHAYWNNFKEKQK